MAESTGSERYDERSVSQLRGEIKRRVDGASARTRLHKETLVKLWYALAGKEPSSPIWADHMYKTPDMVRRRRIARVVGFEYDPESPRSFNRDELIQILDHLDRFGEDGDRDG